MLQNIFKLFLDYTYAVSYLKINPIQILQTYEINKEILKTLLHQRYDVINHPIKFQLKTQIIHGRRKEAQLLGTVKLN